MSVTYRIFCPRSGDKIRGDLEYDGEAFFGPEAQLVGAGGWDTGFDVEFERDDGDEWRQWVEQLRLFLRESGYPIGTYIEVFLPEWNEGEKVPRFRVFDH